MNLFRGGYDRAITTFRGTIPAHPPVSDTEGMLPLNNSHNQDYGN